MVYSDSMEDLSSWAAKIADEIARNKPKKGQVWVLRTCEDSAILLAALKSHYTLPSKVRVVEHHLDWHGERVLVVDEANPGSEPRCLPCFGSLYKLYRPTAWEHLQKDSGGIPLDPPAGIER